MTLHELKRNLAALTLGELEALGIDMSDEDTSDVKVMTSSDDHNEKHGEVVWITSINNEKDQVVIIANGMLYTKEETEETGKSVEVGRVYVNKEKAEILIEALGHAYPELVCRNYPIMDDDDDDDDASYDEVLTEGIEHLIYESTSATSKYPSKIISITSDTLIDTYQDIKNKILDKLSGDDGLPEKVTLTSFSDGKVSTFIGTVPGSKNVEVVEVNVEEMAKNKSDLKQITIRDKRVVDEIVAQFDAG